ncbi:uncharacterized protein VICG_01350 [Vittaforma corneae ATCC 50505]|uniref:U three protein 7 n=1 Tax=Vittaforma corneae (strain ATCC 50505) TaxID=993615 RepID=L2GMT2_VITCO|nr:uncharacterized protein VICG_01350 [Vittaforma corneae ATCC 50505]ELA41602.1 hypothetical protein VICG_01350 [Vittaforma corneae ATCC 50505]
MNTRLYNMNAAYILLASITIANKLIFMENFNTQMHKKEVKQNIKDFHKAVEDNVSDLKTLDILRPALPEQQVFVQTQQYIQNNVNLYTKEKAINISLENGPYKCTYTHNGSHMLVNNKNGYISGFNTQNLQLCFESNIEDSIYDTKWLHNEQYFATAQEDCVFVYDKMGRELHAVRDMKSTRMIEFLPYHFLLAGTTTSGFMNYLDTSTGEIVSSLFISDKNPSCIKASPTNGVVHLGSKNGQVSLWSPSQKSFLMKIKCHKSTVTNVELDRSGVHMITTGNDNRIAVFDIRNTYRPMKSIGTKTSVHFSALSQRNLLAFGFSDKIAVLKDFHNKESCVMKYKTSGIVSSLEFCSHEDILTIGHSNGFCSIVVPGSGDPVYDTTEVSPFMSAKGRNNLEVKKLLEKIPADMIALKSVLNQVEKPARKIEETKRYYETDGESRTALSRFEKKS